MALYMDVHNIDGGVSVEDVAKDEFSSRLAESYGDDCAAEVLPYLS